MPILQASIKHARQSQERRLRRQPYKTSMKTGIRKVQDLMKDGKTAEAQKALSSAFKAIDTAAKKNLIHWKNAAKKKSALQKLVSPKKK
jgi:small subunit ribosomal protein S20